MTATYQTRVGIRRQPPRTDAAPAPDTNVASIAVYPSARIGYGAKGVSALSAPWSFGTIASARELARLIARVLVRVGDVHGMV